MKKTVVVVGAGGRESALIDKYAQSPHVGRLIAVPGNDLMSINTNKKVITYQHLKTTSITEILEIVKNEKVDLVDVAQDNAVEVGLVDELRKIKIQVVGPTRAAGRIEWDKAWARHFGKKYKLPQPHFNFFKSQKDGEKYIKGFSNRKWFIKASGLAEGKGALPAHNNKEAVEKIKELKERFPTAAETYLVEEWLEGEEFSTYALCDGRSFKIIASAQDHKRVFDGDYGDNTGGMGCSTPPLVLTKKLLGQVEDIFEKTIAGLYKEKRPYTGVLYLGGIIVNDKVFIIEFNARWGDPEAQVILPGIENDLYEVGIAIAKGDLNRVKIKMDGQSRVVIAATTKGYPGNYPKGKEIFGIDDIRNTPDIRLYGAGIRVKNNRYYTNGGRVLYVIGEGKDVIEARDKAYKAIAQIKIEDNMLHYRKDIGHRDLKRLKVKAS